MFPNGPDQPDGRCPSFQARHYLLADALLLATLAVMSETNSWTEIDLRGQVQVDGKSSKIAAIPKLPSTSALDRCTLSIDALEYGKGIAQTIRAPVATMFQRGQGTGSSCTRR